MNQTMEGKYFVMLRTATGNYTPLRKSGKDLAQFKKIKEARTSATNSYFGSKFGYKVFNINKGL